MNQLTHSTLNMPVSFPAMKSGVSTLFCKLALAFVLSQFLFLSTAKATEFDNVTINGEPINSEEFIAYKNYALPVQDYCYPHTDKHVLNHVIGLKLIVEAGREAGYRTADRSETQQDADNHTAPDDLDYRYALLSSMLTAETSDYLNLLLGEKADYNLKEKYLYMLATNDPIIVDVTLVRVAQLTFNNRVDADEAMERLLTDEPIDEIAADLERIGSSIIEQKSRWRHINTLPPLEGGNMPDVGTRFGPYAYSREWHIGEVLESKKSPVMLLNDELRRYEYLTSGLRKHIDRKNYQTLVKQLWDAADIEINGKNAAYPDTNLCGDPEL